MNAYLLLSGAILFEVTGTVALKAADGFSRLLPSLLVVLAYAVSFVLLGLSLQRGLHVGAAYAIWSAVGTSVIALLGVLLFNESLSTIGVVGISLIVVGVVLLQIGQPHPV